MINGDDNDSSTARFLFPRAGTKLQDGCQAVLRIRMKKIRMRIQEKNFDAYADPDAEADADSDAYADSCSYWTMASQVIVLEIFKGTVQREFSSVFLTYMDRPRPENEPLLNITFFRNSEKC